jgi:hypothetical protein
MPDEATMPMSMAVSVSMVMNMTMIVAVGMSIRMRVASRRADACILLQLLHASRVEGARVRPSSLDASMGQRFDDGLEILLSTLG